MATPNLRPQITLSETDHRQLMLLAGAGSGQIADANEDLFAELDRARVVKQDKISPEVVRMGSRVTYSTDAGEVREVSLVYPKEADISAGRVSVLTPIGTALLGLKTGQSITWHARGGQKRVLTVQAVAQPVPES